MTSRSSSGLSHFSGIASKPEFRTGQHHPLRKPGFFQQTVPARQSLLAIPDVRLPHRFIHGVAHGNHLLAHARRTMGARKSKLVKKLFAEWHDPKLGDRIATAFRSKYEDLRSANVLADEAFFELWKFAGGGSRSSIELEAAVLAVLAFLFEECDIFEAPRVEAVN